MVESRGPGAMKITDIRFSESAGRKMAIGSNGGAPALAGIRPPCLSLDIERLGISSRHITPDRRVLIKSWKLYISRPRARVNEIYADSQNQAPVHTKVPHVSGARDADV